VPAVDLLAYFDGQRARVAVASAVAADAVASPSDPSSKPVATTVKPDEVAKADKIVKPAAAAADTSAVSAASDSSTTPSGDGVVAKQPAMQPAQQQMITMTLADLHMLFKEREALLLARIDDKLDAQADKITEKISDDVVAAGKDVKKQVKKAATDVKQAVKADGKKTRAHVTKELAEIENDIISRILQLRHAAVPSLAVLAPRENTSKMQKWNPKNCASDTFALHLMCEMPEHRHFLPAAPYEVKFPKPFVSSCAPFLANLLKFAQVLLKLPLPFMPNISISDDLVAGVAGLAKGGADGLPGLADDV
jgi:hypothetical protein